MSPHSSTQDGSVDLSDLIAAIAALFAFAALIISVVIARGQSAFAQRAQLLPVVNDLLQEFLQPEFRQHREYIEHRLAIDNPNPGVGTANWTPEAELHARPVMRYFNSVGLLLKSGTITIELAASMMGGSVILTWKVLGPYICAQRATARHGDANYYGYFEHLAVKIQQLPPGELADRLKLEKWTPPMWPPVTLSP